MNTCVPKELAIGPQCTSMGCKYMFTISVTKCQQQANACSVIDSGSAQTLHVVIFANFEARSICVSAQP